MCNDDVRLFMKRFGITQIELAETLHTSQSAISLALRRELPEEKKQRYKTAIRETARRLYGPDETLDYAKP